MKRQLVVCLGVLAAAVSGCHEKKAPAAPPPPPSVVVSPVLQQDVPVYGEWIGTTAGNDNAEIRPKVDGYLLRRTYQEGGLVSRGQLLFEIDPRQVQAQLEQAQANLAQGKAGLAKAERDVARFEPLAAQKAVSQQELDNARSALQAAQATVGALTAAVSQARLNLTWTKVTSPIAGIAGTALQQVGNLVSPTTVLTTVSQCDPIRVVYQIGEQEYLHLREKLQKESAGPAGNGGGRDAGGLELVLADGSVFPQKGHLLFEDRQVDPRTGTLATVGVFPNPGNLLRPGQYAKVRAVTDLRKAALLVPQRAVNELQGGFRVAVVGDDNKARIVDIAPGAKVGSLQIVDNLPGKEASAGLQAGDRVVVEGFSRVKAGSPVKAEDAKPDSVTAGTASGAPAPAAGGR